MRTFLQLISLIVTMLIFSAGMAIASGIGTFYVNTEAYHGPIYVSPDGSTLASCHNNVNWRVYESDHFLVYCDRSSDTNCSKYAGMSETEFASVKATLGVTDGELGISTTEPSTKPHICSDWNSEAASGDSSGISMPALDESNAKMDPLDRLDDFAGYRNTIRHEMTHLFQSTLAADSLYGTKLELWFTEGMAVYIAHHRILMDTLSLGDYYAAGRPNPVTAKTRNDMGIWTNEDMYPAFGLAVKYLFDSTARGGAGNGMSRIKDILNKIYIGKSFSVAFGETFTKAGALLTLADYRTNFQSWMNAYLSNLETPGTVTGASGLSMVGIFLNYRGCDLISGLGATVTSSGAFTLNVSELANGSYALCFGDGYLFDSNIYGPAMVTVSGGRLTPTNYNISLWSENCTYTLSPSSYGISSSGGTGNIAIIPSSSSCAWAATSNDSWITITLGSSGTGSGTVSYSIAANTTGSNRTGTITIGGQTFTITQQASATTEFVRQQYRDFLNREADAGGLQYWVNIIDSGAMTRAQVIDSFFWSEEFGGRIAPIVRLYFAYFLRIPDYAGLMSWINAYNSGGSLGAISDSFAGSEEFQQRYGSLSNEAFVNLVYQNVLGRAPEPGGYAHWVGELNSGRRTRGQVMLEFSESAEYEANSSNEVFVTMMYVGMLRRSPEEEGFSYWVNYLDSGNSGLAFIDGFLNSQEYADRF